MKKPREIIEEWIVACEDEIKAGNPKFNEWDIGFIEHVSDQMDRTGFLTDVQIDKLEQIYAHKTP